MRILAIAGSLRKHSFNHQLAEAAQEVVYDIDPSIEFELLDWSDVPIFNQDEEYPTPDAVVHARQEVKKADGVWVFTPEYNHSYPGALKNLIDWLSRPVSETQGHVLRDKPIAFCGTSIGMSGSSHAQDLLMPLLGFLEMRILTSPRLVLPYIARQTDERGKLKLDSSEAYLKRQAEALIAFLKDTTPRS